MYKLRIWIEPGKDWWVQLSPDEEDWEPVDTLDEASELTIYWIEKNLGDIYCLFHPELLEIVQVREHSK